MENEMEWFTWDLAGLYKKDGSPATIFTETSEFHPDSLPLLSGTSEREAHRYLQDLGKITAAMEAGKIAPHHKWYIWRRNLWAINIVLRSYLATLPSSSGSSVSFREVPYFPSLGAEFTLLRQRDSRDLFEGYLTICAHWIDELELLVFQGHATSPERSLHLYLTRYTAKVRRIYERIESMKKNNVMPDSLLTHTLSTATSSNIHTSEQATESLYGPDIASMFESLIDSWYSADRC